MSKLFENFSLRPDGSPPPPTPSHPPHHLMIPLHRATGTPPRGAPCGNPARACACGALAIPFVRPCGAVLW